ncbi:OmpA family protein [Penaeicola halotolerans]|uniref:OmpA family protein n=1 Tax=Penaeicola halotolerans TaxID=2793196 RepID=UPI001CF853A5|nr:OmpA family protein [Penaeicola halotolerans]
MKKLILLLSFISLFSCDQKKESPENNESNTKEMSSEMENPKTESISTSSGFDISAIPISKTNISDLVFFNLPNGYKFDNPKNIIDYDQFAFFVDKETYLFKEGKLFQSRISTIDWNKKFSLIELLRNIENVIESSAGQKIFEGMVSRESVEKINEKVKLYNYDGYGFLGYAKTFSYLIRNEDKETWIQITESDDDASVCIGVLQTKNLQISASLKTAEEIESELLNNGKSILYINFETNKSHLTNEGLQVVNQIVNALNNNNSLNISIEGHTDSTGDIAHNQRLSEERAKSVKNELVAKGIAESRLKSTGFGQSKPFVENDSEENMAKNRRVELVRIK